MKPMSYTEARANFASVLDTATEDLEEVVITRAGHEPAVVVALSEYQALQETAYLLGNPANARHLERSIAEHRGGGATPRELVDVAEDEDEGETKRPSVRVYSARPPHFDAEFPAAARYLNDLVSPVFAAPENVDPEEFSAALRMVSAWLSRVGIPESERKVTRRKAGK
ncbi:type II toxin-antitoxin system prevent-host-death family antitoxin [Nocardia beijingensis]|uniref:type II toxin-antitoxin system Phd/YefM family antitoxin n=1 Tax=Nocardia beijingensis TaxID=95162 RepID=UPI0033339BAC